MLEENDLDAEMIMLILSADEQRLRELIEAGRVNYVPLTVERIGIAEEVETWE